MEPRGDQHAYDRDQAVASGLIASGLASGILTTLPAQSQTGSPTMKPTIGIDSAVTTLVSVFTLRDPANQPKLPALLQEGEELYSKSQEGG